MKRARKARLGKSTKRLSVVRATISFPRGIYESLEEIAKTKKVSLAWVVREASEQYVADRWPLLHKLEGQ